LPGANKLEYFSLYVYLGLSSDSTSLGSDLNHKYKTTIIPQPLRVSREWKDDSQGEEPNVICSQSLISPLPVVSSNLPNLKLIILLWDKYTSGYSPHGSSSHSQEARRGGALMTL
jgi:hypothetical protein